MFAPLLFTDRKRDRYKGSLDILWGLQMFLTNSTFLFRFLCLSTRSCLIFRSSCTAFLIPYMAIRLNVAETESIPKKPSQLASVMTNGAPVVGLIGGAICFISAIWALYGRMDGDFGTIADRLDYLVHYLGSERLAYAFIWDICFYIIFQPWLIGDDNLQNIQKGKIDTVNYLRFVPVVGLISYLLFLSPNEEQ